MTENSATSAARILFLNGLPDDNDAKIVIRNGRRELVVMGSCNIFPSLKPFFQAHEVLLMGESEEHQIELGPRPDLIFNQISDPDTHAIALNRAEMICQRANLSVINAVELIRQTRRDKVAENLAGIPGLIVPKTVRQPLTHPRQLLETAEQHRLRFPLIVRSAGAHGGKQMVRVETPEALDSLHRLPLDGRMYYISEFHDFRNADGYYRKCRIALLNGKPLLIHWLVYHKWNVHTVPAREFLRNREDRLANEEEVVFKRFFDAWPPHFLAMFRAIHEKIRLDFFGIDCSITDDEQLVVFEVNANMNMLPPLRNRFPRQEFRIRRRQRLTQMLVDLVHQRLAQRSIVF